MNMPFAQLTAQPVNAYKLLDCLLKSKDIRRRTSLVSSIPLSGFLYASSQEPENYIVFRITFIAKTKETHALLIAHVSMAT